MEMIIRELVHFADQQSGAFHLGSLISAHQYLKLYNLVYKYLKPGVKVLDWGAGSGHFSYFLCLAGFKPSGFSMENYTFSRWVKKFGYKFVKGKPDQPIKLPFKGSYFNGVISVGVLEHVDEYGGNDLESLKEIQRILASEGLLICYHLPNRFSLTELLAKLFTNKYLHHKRYSEAEIEKLLLLAGLKILEIKRYAILPRNSLGKIFRPFKESVFLARIYDLLDNILSFLLSPFCQNYYFVAQKEDMISSNYDR